MYLHAVRIRTARDEAGSDKRLSAHRLRDPGLLFAYLSAREQQSTAPQGEQSMMKCLSALLCALAVAPITAQANLLTNGSFEDPLIPDGTFALFASIPGWTLGSGPAIELQ